MLWTSDEAVAATGGRTTGPWAARGVSIDTRTLQPGDLFVALKDVRDGHDFVGQALEKGAAAALVSRVPDGLSSGAPLLVVPDVLKALEDLGRAARARAKARVVGVTGSVGKTSTKEMLRVVLGGQGRVHAAEASYNNHWGVPLTLARLPREADFAVIEIGMNHPGEIAPLSRMARPDVVVVTTVAPAHLEAFESVEGIAHEKASIIDGLQPGGVAILQADVVTSPILCAKAKAAQVRSLTFGAAEAADYRMVSVQIGDDSTVVRATRQGQPVLYKVMSPGRHFAANGVAVLAVADALGLDPVISATDLGRWQPPAGRGVRERIMLDLVEETGFELIDDAFNANPASMAASLEVLVNARPQDGIGSRAKGRRIAILGDMLELGPTEAALHAALPRGQRGDWVATAAELVPRARHLIDAGDIILVKGSKGIKVSLMVDALRKLGQPAAAAQGDA